MSNYLHRRSDVFYFRYRIPILLQPYLGKTELKVSLHTGNRVEAQLKSYPYLAIVSELKQLQQKVNSSLLDINDIPDAIKTGIANTNTSQKQINELLSGKEQSNSQHLLQDLVQEYIAFKVGKNEWREKTAEYNAAILIEFAAINGNGLMAAITKADIESYLIRLGGLPKNRKKKYPELTLQQCLEREFPKDERPSSRTLKEKLVAINAFFNWCMQLDLIEKNPCSNVSVKSSSQSYVPFNDTDLERIFSKNTMSSWGHDWQLWLPVLALYTGARQTELAQLEVEDVVLIKKVWCLNINDDGDSKRLKSKAARRLVPIHNKLMELGFIDYVEKCKEAECKSLWPTLKPGRYGLGDKVSKWFREQLKPRCNIVDDPSGGRKVWHSFRHTFITQAMAKGLPLVHVQQIVGHEKSILGETATYTHLGVEELKETIDAIEFDLPLVERIYKGSC